MSQQKKANANNKQQSKEQEKQQYFKCTRNKDALFCCSQKTCNNPAIKCVSSHECESCKAYHKKCPRQIKISKIKQRAADLIQTNPVVKIKSQKGKGQDLIKTLIDQLQVSRNKILKLNVDDWGLSQNYLDILKLSLQGKKGREISQFIDAQPVYPQLQFYVPAQFRKDVSQVKKVNQQLEARALTLYKVYYQLALMDCQLKIIENKIGQNRDRILMSLQLQTVESLHKRLYQAIRLRLTLSLMFCGVEQQTSDQELADFMLITKRLFHLMFQLINELFKQKRYAQVLKYINLIRQLFNQNRKQFRLLESIQIQKQIDKSNQLYALAAYYCDQDELAYQYLKGINDNKLDSELLYILIDICQRLLALGIITNQDLLKYLLLLQKLENTNAAIILKIKQCYTLMGDKNKIYEYCKKLNKLLYSLDISPIELMRWLARQIYCIQFEEKQQKFTQVFTSIKLALDLLRNYSKKCFEIMESQLKIRHMSIIFNKFNKSDYEQTANSAVECCRKYEKEFVKMSQVVQQQYQIKYRRMLKEYLLKFLVFQAQTTSQKQNKEKLLREANKICEELRVRVFEPAYQFAKLLYDMNHPQALLWQNKSNEIYPTDLCYRQKAFLLYKQYFEHGSEDKLVQCIQSANQSLLLMPLQTDLHFLKGMANQNLKRYRQSNKELRKAQQLGLTNFNIQSRIALNNEFIVKNSVDLSQDQKTQLVKQSQLIYKKCLDIQPQNKKCIMGYARTLKLLGKLKQAEKYFQNMKDSTQYSKEAYMFLGNIKQEMAKANDERDFTLLEQALQYYQKAGNIIQNKQNLIRIYKQLDQEKTAQQIQKRTDWN